jgi:hypothetical protein
VAWPGATVGEISVLLGVPCGDTVRTTVPSVLRHAADGRALLDSHPAISRLVAVGLAERLNFVTAYLADLKQPCRSDTNRALATFTADAALRSLAVAPDGITLANGDLAGRVHELKFDEAGAGEGTAAALHRSELPG